MPSSASSCFSVSSGLSVLSSNRMPTFMTSRPKATGSLCTLFTFSILFMFSTSSVRFVPSSGYTLYTAIAFPIVFASWSLEAAGFAFVRDYCLPALHASYYLFLAALGAFEFYVVVCYFPVAGRAFDHFFTSKKRVLLLLLCSFINFCECFLFSRRMRILLCQRL